MKPPPPMPNAPTALGQTLRRARFEVRARIARALGPRWLYAPIRWWDGRKLRRAGHDAPWERAVDARTELVIDGFQGCANSYLVRAFEQHQRRPVRLAHHMHAPVQIVRAVERGLPVLVTIREPRGAALSLTSRWPYVTVRQALRSYAGFYECLVPYRAGFVLSPFERTTQNPGEAVCLLNQTFGTDFALPQPVERPETPERAVREARRQKIKQQKAQAFDDPALQALLARAEAVYAQLTTEAR